MYRYRSSDGRTWEQETPHEGLEASDGWERIEPSDDESSGKDEDEGSEG